MRRPVHSCCWPRSSYYSEPLSRLTAEQLAIIPKEAPACQTPLPQDGRPIHGFQDLARLRNESAVHQVRLQ